MTFLIILTSILLILVVLIQNSNGGGLDSSFSSQTQIFGAKKTTEVIEKLTWGLAAALVVFCIISTKMVSSDVPVPSGDGPAIEAPVDGDLDNTEE